MASIASRSSTLHQPVESAHDRQPSQHEEKQENLGSMNTHHEQTSHVQTENGHGHVPVAGTGIGRVLSRTTVKPDDDDHVEPPPDGGLQAWIQVACSHLIIMNTWGFINSFGVFQTYYTTALNRSGSDISWIGSLQVFLLFFIGALTGRLTDAGYFRHLMLTGSALQLVGIFCAAESSSYWQVLLAQGIAIGLGNGCLFCPSVAVVSTYFTSRRSLAIGVAACGSGTGGLIFPIIARQMLPVQGYAWAMRTIGLVQLAALLIANLFMRQRVKPATRASLVDFHAFRDLRYTFYAAGSFSAFLGVYFAFYYLAAFARDRLGESLPDSLNLLLILNGVGIVGRLIPNYLADVVGPVNVFAPVAMLASVCAFAWIGVQSQAGATAWAACFGIVAGGIQALFPAGLSSLTSDPRKQGTRMGMVFTIVSFAVLIGPPIDGALIKAMNGSYTAAQCFAGAVLLLGSVFMIAARTVKARQVDDTWWKVKV